MLCPVNTNDSRFPKKHGEYGEMIWTENELKNDIYCTPVQ